MKNTFFTSDTHWGHYNIIRHCNRPISIEEHDDWLVDNWNSVVNKKDEVYHLGDFAMFKAIKGGELRMKTYRKLRMRLNGKIHLILGNHDKMSMELYDSFTGVYTGIKEVKVDGERITLCHYPMRSWNRSFHGSMHFFGHVHGRLDHVDTGVSMDVGVDVPEFNYAPVAWETLKPKMIEKRKEWKEKFQKV